MFYLKLCLKVLFSPNEAVDGKCALPVTRGRLAMIVWSFGWDAARGMFPGRTLDEGAYVSSHVIDRRRIALLELGG
jgi:hypothetical protein